MRKKAQTWLERTGTCMSFKERAFAIASDTMQQLSFVFLIVYVSDVGGWRRGCVDGEFGAVLGLASKADRKSSANQRWEVGTT